MGRVLYIAPAILGMMHSVIQYAFCIHNRLLSAYLATSLTDAKKIIMNCVPVPAGTRLTPAGTCGHRAGTAL